MHVAATGPEARLWRSAKPALRCAHMHVLWRVQAEVVRRELAEHSQHAAGAGGVESSTLDAVLAAALPPHCQLCGARAGVALCAACCAVGWCEAHRGAAPPLPACSSCACACMRSRRWSAGQE